MDKILHDPEYVTRLSKLQMSRVVQGLSLNGSVGGGHVIALSKVSRRSLEVQ